MDVIVGTAGHIDHGKTSLVRALTGIDADRLPEEKRRGITIDLGFAEMTVGETHFGFVDVPGHERFVRNMLAGASGIDIVLLVIAADEGVMPQTREHFDICRLLAVKSGVVVLTKSDLVDDETLEIASIEATELVAGSFLERAPIVYVSSRTGDGIDKLKKALGDRASLISRGPDRLIARLPIDRSFSIKGFGTVVTGTLVSGNIVDGAEMELCPDAKRVRVRGLQVHNHSAGDGHAGQRVAVNLAAIDQAAAARGMALADPDVLRPTQIINAELEVLSGAPRPVRSRQRLRVHIGTAEVLARIQVLNESGEIAAGSKGFAQIRIETPVVALVGDRFIVRTYSPQFTIAGGTVADPFGNRVRRKEFDAANKWLGEFLAANEDRERITVLLKQAGTKGLTFADLQARLGLRTGVLREVISSCVAGGAVVETEHRYLEPASFKTLMNVTLKTIADFHNREPLAKGMPLELLRDTVFLHNAEEISRSVTKQLERGGQVTIEKETVRIAERRLELTLVETTFIERLRETYKTAGLDVPKTNDAINAAQNGITLDRSQLEKLVRVLLDAREIIKVTDQFYFAGDVIGDLKTAVRNYASSSPDRLIDVARFKEIAGVSRKYAIPLLEYFDREKVTARSGDKRVILK